jgi:predicted CxxxxCH...CXXCH cytochrome family protein
MRHTVLGVVFGMTASAVLGFGCSSASPRAANSFTAVYADVLEPNCSNVYCHSNGVWLTKSGLDMSSQTIAYWSLVDHLLDGPSCGALVGARRVVPFDPDASYLYRKVHMTLPDCGVQMPADPKQLWPSGDATSTAAFTGTALSSEDQQLIYDWIKEGALNN